MINLLLGAFSNCFIRGSNYVSNGHYTNAVCYGVYSFIISGYWLLGIAMTTAMLIGQSFAIPHDQTSAGNPWPMFFRGVIWTLPIFVVIAVFTENVVALLACIPAMLSMYLVYRSSDLFFKGRVSTVYFNRVTIAEMVYGALLWFPLSFVSMT